MRYANPTFFRLFTHLIRWALALALASAGRSMPARIAMIAMTTSSSMSVKAFTLYLRNTLFMIVLSVIGLRFAHSKHSIRSVNAFSESILSTDGATLGARENRRKIEVFSAFGLGRKGPVRELFTHLA